jgi:cytoskeleton protein RodZ
MSSVGSCLSEMRLKHGFSLAEMARLTRVTQRYLEALESDQFSELPPPVFTRGFIRAFCSTLGESPDTALALYDRHLEATEGPRPIPSRREVQPIRGARTAGAAERPRSGHGGVFVSFVLLVALGAALFAVVMALQGRRESTDRHDVAMARGDAGAVREPAAPAAPAQPPPAEPAAQAPPQTSPSPNSASAAPGAGATASAPPAPSEPPPAAMPGVSVSAPKAAAPAAPAAVSTPAVMPSIPAPYRLVGKTRALTWVRVRTENGKSTEENVPAGEVREWVSNRPFTVTVGNAGGISFELNGRPLPALGADGAVVRDIVVPGS